MLMTEKLYEVTTIHKPSPDRIDAMIIVNSE